jgi:hypothetical protein
MRKPLQGLPILSGYGEKKLSRRANLRFPSISLDLVSFCTRAPPQLTIVAQEFRPGRKRRLAVDVYAGAMQRSYEPLVGAGGDAQTLLAQGIFTVQDELLGARHSFC